MSIFTLAHDRRAQNAIAIYIDITRGPRREMRPGISRARRRFRRRLDSHYRPARAAMATRQARWLPARRYGFLSCLGTSHFVTRRINSFDTLLMRALMRTMLGASRGRVMTRDDFASSACHTAAPREVYYRSTPRRGTPFDIMVARRPAHF